MKVNIAASHRFHLLDLARELSRQGHDVRFYSYIPAWRCQVFGLDRWLCCSMLWLVWPFFLCAKIAPHSWQADIVWYRNRLMDWWVARTMRRCDVFIGLGSVYLEAFERAKAQGATTILEWGSKHILEELARQGKADQYPQRSLDRELRGYEMADYIAIPSEHVKESFLKHGVSETKLLINPYGVDLSQFHPTECTGEFDLIMVGGWSYRKGCDLLVQLCSQYGYRLLHVGSLVDLPFPDVPNMVHHEAVDQMELVDYYARARVFVLPSRTEGLALVQAQAVACGLPVVCSAETGGRDLRRELGNTAWILEMPDLSLCALHTSVKQALRVAQGQTGIRNYAGQQIEQLSWKAYGERYSHSLDKIWQ